MNAIYYENKVATIKPMDLETGKFFPAERGKCFQNSLYTVPFIDNSVYVEGYGIFYNDKIFNLWRHGWVEADGKIIDTYPGVGERFDVMYFLGKRYTVEQALAKKHIPSWHPGTLLFAVKKWHSAIEPNNPFWLSTAAKMIIHLLTKKPAEISDKALINGTD